MSMSFGPAQPLDVEAIFPADLIKQYARVETDDDDLLRLPILRAACGWVERHVSASLASRSWILRLDAFQDRITLPVAPPGAVLTVTYRDQNGDTQALASSAWRQDRDTVTVMSSWPSGASVVAITFTAGFSDVETQAPELYAAALITFSHLWDRRNGSAADAGNALPPGALALCRSWRTPVMA